MKQMKRRLAVLLAFAIAISGISIGIDRAKAENAMTVYGKKVTATAGKEVKIPVMVKDNHGVAGLALKVTYDATAMKPVKAEKGSLISGLSNLQFGDTIANHKDSSFECVAYNDSNFTDNGELFVLTFQMVDAVSAGTYSLKLELTEHYNEALADVETGCEDITVTVSGDGSTKAPGASPTVKPSAKPDTNNNTKATPKPTKKPSYSYDATPKPAKKKKRKVTKKPGRVKITKIKSTGKGKAKVTWKKVNCNMGYQIQYCRNKKFTGKRYYKWASKSKKSCTIKGKSKKTYYVRIYAVSYGYASKYASYKEYMFGKLSNVKKIKLK